MTKKTLGDSCQCKTWCSVTMKNKENANQTLKIGTYNENNPEFYNCGP